jgi:hypothetical protein
MSDVDLEPNDALQQAVRTGQHYLREAFKILEEEYPGYTVEDSIQLAKVMAQDFHTAMMCRKMQEVRDAIIDLNLH